MYFVIYSRVSTFIRRLVKFTVNVERTIDEPSDPCRVRDYDISTIDHQLE